MSPAHLHQYVASISPGQLSESLPSSQVNYTLSCNRKQKKNEIQKQHARTLFK